MFYEINQHLPNILGACNLRDLGGYPTSKGRHTKKNIFFRSDNTANLTGKDICNLKEMGLTLVVDLRSTQEVCKHPSVLSREAGIRYAQVPMLDEMQSSGFCSKFPPSMGTLYQNLLDQSQADFGRIFKLFSQNHGATLFNCTAGKDRTGVTAMLLLELAGVPDEIIIKDYAISEVQLRNVQKEQMEQFQVLGIDIPAYVMASAPVSMQTALAHLREKYKDAHNYLKLCGLDQKEMESILDRFLD